MRKWLVWEGFKNIRLACLKPTLENSDQHRRKMASCRLFMLLTAVPASPLPPCPSHSVLLCPSHPLTDDPPHVSSLNKWSVSVWVCFHARAWKIRFGWKRPPGPIASEMWPPPQLWTEFWDFQGQQNFWTFSWIWSWNVKFLSGCM